MDKMNLYLKGTVAVLALTLFAGCDLLKKKEVVEPKTAEKGAGVALCTINDEVVITEGDFKSSLEQMIQANPYFKGASAETLPKELLRKFFEQLSMQALIKQFSVKNNVEKDPEFIKAYNETEKLLRDSLMVRVFEEKIYKGIQVSEGDIEKYYKENKDRFVKVAGGVLAMGAEFGSDAAANAFLVQAKAQIDNFEKLAKADKAGKFRDFGRVSKESRGYQFETVPGPIKDSVLAMTKLPGIEVIKVGDKRWVVKAWDKKDTTLFDLTEVKGHIEAMLKNNQFKDVLTKRLEELKKDFKIVVNEDYFKPKAGEKTEEENLNKEEAPEATPV
jgi:peptidyl-prolyl cis-trans isomerase C